MYISHAGGRVVKFHADGKTPKWQYQLSLLKLIENDYVSVQKSSSFFVVGTLQMFILMENQAILNCLVNDL